MISSNTGIKIISTHKQGCFHKAYLVAVHEGEAIERPVPIAANNAEELERMKERNEIITPWLEPGAVHEMFPGREYSFLLVGEENRAREQKDQ
ncbi:hypothetical protein [Jeotgalibacillus terrae]|uniref:Uncharacterized protein n=1 Tax=Jeotgalibacillus terrae TaxID=587735 RepID=A0ABW5ZN10_9BACL|nr:hypothetical protein [Jeotgalibacillus terrae]MBM7581078.1 hypothetical protein [Jeotgalibacillus terrae]